MTYTVDDEQYIAVMAGLKDEGVCCQFQNRQPKLVTRS